MYVCIYILTHTFFIMLPTSFERIAFLHQKTLLLFYHAHYTRMRLEKLDFIIKIVTNKLSNYS